MAVGLFYTYLVLHSQNLEANFSMSLSIFWASPGSLKPSRNLLSADTKLISAKFSWSTYAYIISLLYLQGIKCVRLTFHFPSFSRNFLSICKTTLSLQLWTFFIFIWCNTNKRLITDWADFLNTWKDFFHLH